VRELENPAPPTPYEIKIVAKNGEERWLEIMGTPLELDGEISIEPPPPEDIRRLLE
jgi:hypothetical protein